MIEKIQEYDDTTQLADWKDELAEMLDNQEYGFCPVCGKKAIGPHGYCADHL